MCCVYKYTKWILVRQEVGQWRSLDARAFPVPIPKVCASCRTNIHAVVACTLRCGSRKIIKMPNNQDAGQPSLGPRTIYPSADRWKRSSLGLVGWSGTETRDNQDAEQVKQ